MSDSQLIVALDTPSFARAQNLIDRLNGHFGLVKIGLEFFTANGPDGTFRLVQGDCGTMPYFLDLKLHDIPNTVANAVKAVLPIFPLMLTVHALGGPAMIRAAREASEAASHTRPMILAVTILTSLNGADLVTLGFDGTMRAEVENLAAMAVEAGADGIVCSPHEVASLRALLPETKLIVPGIRPRDAKADDQARTMTAKQAIAAGADWIVVGRPITQAN